MTFALDETPEVALRPVVLVISSDFIQSSITFFDRMASQQHCAKVAWRDKRIRAARAQKAAPRRRLLRLQQHWQKAAALQRGFTTL